MKIVAIELYTADLAGTHAFYRRHLGLSIVSESVDSLTLKVGWTRLSFQAVDKPVAPYHFAINVPTGMLEVWMHSYPLDYLTTNGQEIVDLPVWRARASYFYDNNGNLLTFVTRHDGSWFSPNLTLNDLFQGIGEVGITTECVPTTTRQLINRFGIPPFRRFVPTMDSSVLGNDAGLFMITQEGRNWPFTNLPATLNHCQITFELEPGTARQTLYCYGINQLPVEAGKPLFVGSRLGHSTPELPSLRAVFAN